MNTLLQKTMLNQLPVGAFGKITDIAGDKKMRRKMMGLGIKVGAEIELLHHRGKGVVVRSKGTRIAIGESIASQLQIEPIKISEQGT